MIKSFYFSFLLQKQLYNAFLIIYLFANYQLNASGGLLVESCNAGLVQAHMTRIGTKNVYYFGAHHKASTVEQNKQQIQDFIEALKETIGVSGEKLHVLFEKPHFQHNTSLDKALEVAIKTEGLANVTMEDAEIRHNHIEAAERLKSPVYYAQREEKALEVALENENFPHVKIDKIEKLTFEMVLKEYDHWHRKLNTFRRNFKENDPYFTQFDEHWKTMEQDHREFLEFLDKNNIPLDQSIARTALDLKRALGEAPGQALIKELDKLSLHFFSFLFDLHLFKRIFEYDGEHIAFVGGLSHTSEVSSIFFNGTLIPTKVRAGKTPNVADENEYVNIRLLSKEDMVAVLKGSTDNNMLSLVTKISIIIAIVAIGAKKYATKEKNGAVDPKQEAATFLKAISEHKKTILLKEFYEFIV